MSFIKGLGKFIAEKDKDLKIVYIEFALFIIGGSFLRTRLLTALIILICAFGVARIAGEAIRQKVLLNSRPAKVQGTWVN